MSSANNFPVGAGVTYFTMTWYNNLATKAELESYLKQATLSTGNQVVAFKNSNGINIGIMFTNITTTHPSGSTTEGYGSGVFIGYYYGTNAPTIVYFKCVAGTYTLKDIASEISSLDSDISALDTSVTGISSDVGTLTTNVGTLSTNLTNVTNRVSTVESAALRAAYKEYSFGNTSVTSGQAYDVGKISDIIPSGASFKGISLRTIYGYSSTDYSGTIMVSNGDNNTVRYMCRYTQTNVTVRYYVYYTI